MAGFDEKGTHLYQLCPSANYYSCKSMAIGARSQSARTYLEKNLEKFADSNQDELIKHCMRALRDTLPNEVELTVKVNFSDLLSPLLNEVFRTARSRWSAKTRPSVS